MQFLNRYLPLKMFLNIHCSLKTDCHDSEGKFVTKVPTKTTKCDVDTCSQIGELNSAFSAKDWF